MLYSANLIKKSASTRLSITQFTMNIFGSKAAIKMTVKITRFSSFSCNFCYIWWFFWVLQCICALHFEKSSNTVKSLEKMKKNPSIILIPKWPHLEPKMFTVHWEISSLSRRAFYFPCWDLLRAVPIMKSGKFDSFSVFKSWNKTSQFET